MNLPKKKAIILCGGPFDGLVTYQGVYDNKPYPESLNIAREGGGPSANYKKTTQVNQLGFKIYSYQELG